MSDDRYPSSAICHLLSVICHPSSLIRHNINIFHPVKYTYISLRLHTMNVIKNQRYAYEETRYALFFEFKNVKGERLFL